MDRWDLEDLKAVALRYREKEDYAPVVLAKGRGYLAEAILALARQAGVTVLVDPAHLAMLEKVEVGEYIPPEAYTLAAEVIAFLMRLEGRLERGEGRG